MKACKLVLQFFFFLITLSPANFSQTPPAQSSTQSSGQEQDQTLRIRTNLVQVRAVVTDKQGRIIENLRKEDFVVSENGRPQELSFFSADKVDGETPSVSAATPAPTVAGAANAPASRAEDPRRTIVLFVDTIHLDHIRLARVKETLNKFLDQQMTNQDLVAVVASGGRLGLLSQFTRDKKLLRSAINSLAPWAPGERDTILTPYIAGRALQGDLEALSLAFQIIQGESGMQRPEEPDFIRNPRMASVLRQQYTPRFNAILSQAAYRRRAALSTLDGVVAQMARLPGQRMIFLFSEGFTQMGFGGSVELSDFQQSVSRAVSGGVMIYSLDAKGIDPVMQAADTSVFIVGNLTTAMNSAAQESLQGLRALALDTGGNVVINTNNFAEQMQKALRENSVSYVLAYYPADDKDPKKLRNLSVQIKDHPEYKVRTQKGYRPADIEKIQAAKEALTPRQKLIAAMNLPLPTTTFGIAAIADYLEREGDEMQLALQIYFDGDTPECQPASDASACEIEIAISVHDLGGKLVKAFTDALNFNLKPDQLAAVKQSSYRYYRRIGLKPGTYQIRAGIREPKTERLGTTSLWVDVPDLSRDKLQMSNLLFGNFPVVKETDSLVEGGTSILQPRVSQGVKLYRRGETLEYNFFVYASPKDSPAALTVQIEIIQGEQKVYQSAPVSVESRMVGRDKKGIGVTGAMLLNSVEPGLYELRVTVKHAKNKQTVQQSTTFAVER